MADNKLIVELVLEPTAERSAFNKVGKKAGVAGKQAGDEFSKSFSVGLKSNIGGIAKGLFGVAAAVSVVRSSLRQLSEGLDSFRVFQKGIFEVNSILPKNQKLTEQATQSIQNFSAQFGGTQQKQARAFYNIVSAGVKGTARQLKTLEIANTAAVAGLVDIDTSARAIVSSVNAYSKSGLTATEASDALFVAVREGQTTFGELADTLGNVTSIAANVGVKFDELAGAVAFVTKSGIKTDVAVTGLRQVFASIIKPSAEAATEASRLGLNFSKAGIQADGFAEFLKKVQVATNGNESSLAKLFGNIRALAPILNIVNGDFDEFKRIIDETGMAAGSTSDAFNEISKSLDFKIDKAQSSFDLLRTNIAEQLTPALTEFVEQFNAFTDIQNQKFSNDALVLLDKKLLETIEKQERLKSAIEATRSAKFAAPLIKELKDLEIEEKAFLVRRKKLITQRSETEKKASDKAVEVNKANNSKILADNKSLEDAIRFLGIDKEAALQIRYEQENALLISAKEKELLTLEEFNERRLFLEQQLNEKLTAIRDQRTLDSAASFESISEAFKVLGKDISATSGAIAKTAQSVLAGGIGKASSQIGANLRAGKGAFDDFGLAVEGIFGDLASSIGDFYIKDGIAKLAGGYPGGAAEISAGLGLKVLGGFLGGSSSGSSDSSSSGGAASSDFGSGVNSDALEEQNIVQAEAQDNIQLVVQGSIFNTSETAKDLTKLLNENFESTGAALTNTRFA
jgi:TP901 family phage tail tape measure protein